MRGWKVVLDEKLYQIQVGKSRGAKVELQGRGLGHGRRSNLKVLLVEELPESFGEDHEKALVEALQDHHSGDWVVMAGTGLHPRWEELTRGEQRRLMQREGFEEIPPG
jgi:hypothetical protein